MNNFTLRSFNNIYTGIKCFKYKVEIYYILQNKFKGEKFDIAMNNIFQIIRKPFKALEEIEIYIPIERREFEKMVEWIKNTSISREKKPSEANFIQYFVNYQIVQQLQKKLDKNDWTIEIEPHYNPDNCRNRADVSISHNSQDFTIWIESDNKRTDQIYKKLWQKMSIIGESRRFNNDVFCTFIYTTQPYKKAVHKCFIDTQQTIINNIEGNNLRGSYVIIAIIEDDNKEIYSNNMILNNDSIIVIPIIKITQQQQGTSRNIYHRRKLKDKFLSNNQ